MQQQQKVQTVHASDIFHYSNGDGIEYIAWKLRNYYGNYFCKLRIKCSHEPSDSDVTLT